jgi:excisionase family DNA binding protein
MTSPTDVFPPIATPSKSESSVLSDTELSQVQRLAQLISKELHGHDGQPRFSLLGPKHELMPLPADVLPLLQQLLAILASGDAVSVVPVHKELTTQQAAHLLNISRQYFVQLLDEGKIPFHRTGSHRRVYSKDVLAYRAHRKADRRTQLDAMIQETQEAGGYPEFE